MIKAKNNFFIFFLAVTLWVVCLLSTQSVTALAYAETENSFDKTDVLDDLRSSRVNGLSFKENDYPYNENGTLQVLNFVEYCYSQTDGTNYGLYLYVYNPRKLEISEKSAQNKVSLCLTFDADGNPLKFEKYRLRCVSQSDLFFKFKVVDRKINGKTIWDTVKSSERVYAVSGIELLTKFKRNATEYTVGSTFTFTGFAAGYGSEESTLSCSVKILDTLRLDVNHTYYRTNVSSLGKGHYNEVNTVYFSVPEKIFTANGFLQKIRAEWWEYKTKPVVVTSSREFYDVAKNYTGVNVGYHSDDVPFSLWYGMDSAATSSGNVTHDRTSYEWAYNIEPKDINQIVYTNKVTIADHSEIIPLVFHSEAAVSVDRVFNFLYSDPVAGDVAGTKLAEAIYSYSNSLGNGYIDCNGRNISKDLFQDNVDSGRTMGYNDKTIDLNDTFDLSSYDSNHSWWDKLWDYGFSWPSTSGDYKNVAPIYELQASDLIGLKDDVAEKLLVNPEDVSKLSTFYATETAKGNRVILFRFANTDYFSMPVGRTGVSEGDADTYIATQTVFLDFDIIELTFNRDGEYRVIPVVSSPMDIINDITAPKNEKFDFVKLLTIILACLAVVFVVYWLIKIINSAENRRNNKR